MLKYFRGPKEFTGKHMLIAMVSFFAVILSVNLTMAFFASKSWTGLVTASGYKDNQVFDKKTDEIETMLRAGFRLVPEYKNEKIIFHVHTHNSEPVSNAKLDVIVGRVTHERDDVYLRFNYQARGLYVVDHSLAPGLWQLKVLMSVDGVKHWQKTYRLIVREQQ